MTSRPSRDNMGAGNNHALALMASSNTNLGWALTTLLRDYLRQVDDALAGLPGSSRGYAIMSAIAEETCQSQIALAEKLGLDRTTVTYLIDGLENENLLRRTPDPADRRVRHVNLTETGVRRLEQLAQTVNAVETEVLARLTAPEAEQFRAILTKAAGLSGKPDTAEMCQAAREAEVEVNPPARAAAR
jgi:MarR family transcriptional regulator, transcriptional regulator for hemolysin